MFKPLHLVRSARPLAVIAAAPLILSGCQAIVSNPPVAQVRIIDASPDVQGLDIYQDSTPLAYNLGFGTLTSYIEVSPSTSTITTNAAGSKQIFTASKATLLASGHYTVLIGNEAATLQQVVLTDQSQPAPAGQISLRFIDQAARSGAVDIYLVPSGQKLTAISPVITNVSFDRNTGYLDIPSGTYSLVLLPAGTVPTSNAIATYSGAQVTYSAGAVRTIVLLDQQLISGTGLQVITADDFDPPAATS